jgi:hypothetical protein
MLQFYIEVRTRTITYLKHLYKDNNVGRFDDSKSLNELRMMREILREDDDFLRAFICEFEGMHLRCGLWTTS